MRHMRWLGALALAGLLLCKPEAAALGAAQAMARWYGSVAPAMLPFLALMPLLTCREAAQAYEALLGPAMRALFNLPGAAAPAMVVGMIAGSPAGTVAARNAAASSGMDRGQLRRLAASASGFSPAFLIGGVGAGMLGSAALGWRLYLAQMATQLTLALLLRRAWRDQTQPVKGSVRASGEQPVRDAVLTALTVCGYMAVFGAICFAIRASVGPVAGDALLCLMDVPSGAGLLAGLEIPMDLKLALLAALCGFGGACVAAQNLNVLKGCGIGAAGYVGTRLLGAALSGGYMLLLARLPTLEMGAWSGIAGGNPLTLAALIAAALSVPALIKLKKLIF